MLDLDWFQGFIWQNEFLISKEPLAIVCEVMEPVITSSLSLLSLPNTTEEKR